MLAHQVNINNHNLAVEIYLFHSLRHPNAIYCHPKLAPGCLSILNVALLVKLLLLLRLCALLLLLMLLLLVMLLLLLLLLQHPQSLLLLLLLLL